MNIIDVRLSSNAADAVFITGPFESPYLDTRGSAIADNIGDARTFGKQMELLEQPVVRPTLNLSGTMELVPGTLKPGVGGGSFEKPSTPRLP
ncbi:hypothetical protein ACWJKU_11390 [Methylocaldum sp. MU1018]